MIRGIEVIRPAPFVAPGTVLPAGPPGLAGPPGSDGPPGPQGGPGVTDLADDDQPGLVAAGERAAFAAKATPEQIKEEAADGDYKAPGTNTLIRTIGEHINEIPYAPEDAGAVGNGTTVDTTKVADALTDALGADLFLPNRYRIGSVTVGRRSAVFGQSGSGLVPYTESWYGQLSTLILDGPSATIGMSVSARFSDALIVRTGLTMPQDTQAVAVANRALFTGTAFTATGLDASDVQLERLSIFGHNRAAVIDGTDASAFGARGVLRDIRFDCNEGFFGKNLPDVARWEGLHGWPFSSYIPGVNPATGWQALQSSGVAYYVQGACDWMQMRGCFSYGYAYSVVLDGTSNVQVIDHQADNVSYSGVGAYKQAAYKVMGDAETSRFINPTAISHPIGIVVDAAGSRAAAGRISASVHGGLFVCDKAFDLVRGHFEAFNVAIQGGGAVGAIHVHGSMGDFDISLARVGAVSGNAARVGKLLKIDLGWTGRGTIRLPDQSDPGYDTLLDVPQSIIDSGRLTIIGGPTQTRSVTPTASSGSLTSASATVRWRQVDSKLVWFQAVVTINTNGSAGGSLMVPLPFPAAGGTAYSILAGQIGGTSTALIANVAAGALQVSIVQTGGTYPGADGRTLVVSGTYERA